MKKNLLVLVIAIFVLAFCSSSIFAQTKTIFVTPETAKIYYNGHEVGNGTYQIKFKKKEDFAVLKFEAPGYIPRTVKLFRNNPKNTISY